MEVCWKSSAHARCSCDQTLPNTNKYAGFSRCMDGNCSEQQCKQSGNEVIRCNARLDIAGVQVCKASESAPCCCSQYCEGGASIVLSSYNIGTFTLLGITLVCVALFLRYCITEIRGKQSDSHDNHDDDIGQKKDVRRAEGIDESTLELSSGHTGILLEQRGLVQEIKLRGEPMGAGGYGQVFYGRWASRHVAVKRILDERIFLWEHNLQNNWPLRHPNIVEFYGGATEHSQSLTYYWIVTRYQPLGSLTAYLQEKSFRHTQTDRRSRRLRSIQEIERQFSTQSFLPLSANIFQDGVNLNHLNEVLRLATSLVAGLDYLHAYYPGIAPGQGQASTRQDIYSIRKKPIIAHCDIKSQNVLVRDNLTCCITDFGHAVYGLPDSGTLHMPVHLETKGTKRYLPPEHLNGSANAPSLMTYIRQDVYSLALVLWEIAQCCPTPDRLHPYYCTPYHDALPIANPSASQVKVVVCDRERRPPIPAEWQDCQVLRELSAVITSCWNKTPSQRPMSPQISQRLKKIGAKLIRLSVTSQDSSTQVEVTKSGSPEQDTDLSTSTDAQHQPFETIV